MRYWLERISIKIFYIYSERPTYIYNSLSYKNKVSIDWYLQFGNNAYNQGCRQNKIFFKKLVEFGNKSINFATLYEL